MSSEDKKQLFTRGKPIHVPQLYKAQTIGGRTAPDLNLIATQELPDAAKGIYDEEVYGPACRKQFDEQAEIILTALIESMPGGTIDALLIRLLQHRRSLFVVPYARWREVDDENPTDLDLAGQVSP